MLTSQARIFPLQFDLYIIKILIPQPALSFSNRILDHQFIRHNTKCNDKETFAQLRLILITKRT